MDIPLATQLHEKHKVYLGKLILYGLYESLEIYSQQILDFPYCNSVQIEGLVWLQ